MKSILKVLLKREVKRSKGKSPPVHPSYPRILLIRVLAYPSQKQTTLDAYFQARPYYSVDATNMSKRVVEAINIMRNKVDVDVSQLPTKSPRKPRGATSSRGAKKSARGSSSSTRGGASTSTSPRKPFFASPAKTTVVPGQEFIPQREKDRLEAAKRKLEAVKIFRAKRKTAATQKKRKVLQPKKDSSYLSESSSGSDDD